VTRVADAPFLDAGAVQLPAAVCLALCHDLPRARDLDGALRIVDGVRESLLGPGLLTVNLNSSAGATAPAGAEDVIDLQRIWTSNPQAYPVAGRKRKTMTPWTLQLLRRAEVFVGEGDEVLAGIFDDHALIASLGLRAIVNVPLLDGAGACFATFNLLGQRPQWKPEEVLLVRLLALLATPAIGRAAADAGMAAPEAVRTSG
jgi:hypothetical protein